MNIKSASTLTNLNSNWLEMQAPLTIMLPRFAEHVTIIFMIHDEFANSLVMKLQYFWQMLWSVVV